MYVTTTRCAALGCKTEISRYTFFSILSTYIYMYSYFDIQVLLTGMICESCNFKLY